MQKCRKGSSFVFWLARVNGVGSKRRGNMSVLPTIACHNLSKPEETNPIPRKETQMPHRTGHVDIWRALKYSSSVGHVYPRGLRKG